MLTKIIVHIARSRIFINIIILSGDEVSNKSMARLVPGWEAVESECWKMMPTCNRPALCASGCPCMHKDRLIANILYGMGTNPISCSSGSRNVSWIVYRLCLGSRRKSKRYIGDFISRHLHAALCLNICSTETGVNGVLGSHRSRYEKPVICSLHDWIMTNAARSDKQHVDFYPIKQSINQSKRIKRWFKIIARDFTRNTVIWIPSVETILCKIAVFVGQQLDKD